MSKKPAKKWHCDYGTGHGSVYKDKSWYHMARFIKHVLDEGGHVKAVWKDKEEHGRPLNQELPEMLLNARWD